MHRSRMEKKDNNMTRSGEVDLVDETPRDNHHLHQYSELLKVSVKYWMVKGQFYSEIKEQRDDDDVESEVKGMKKVLESDELDHHQKKLKAINTRYRRFAETVDPNKGTLCLCIRRLVVVDKEKWIEDNQSTHNFAIEQARLNNIYVLVDVASTELRNIKAYNTKTLALIEDGNLNEVTLHDYLRNLYLSFYKAMGSLDLKIDILSLHLEKPPQSRPETSVVDRYSAWVEDELRQYEEELETTKSIVFELLENKFGGLRWFGLGLVPDTWKARTARYLRTVILDARLQRTSSKTKLKTL